MMREKAWEDPRAWAIESMRWSAESLVEAARHWRSIGEYEPAARCEAAAQRVCESFPPGTDAPVLHCGAPFPDNPVIRCILTPGHDGDHWRSGLGWAQATDNDQTPGEEERDG